MKKVYRVKAWRMKREGGRMLCPGKEERLFSTRGRAERWLIKNRYRHGPEPAGKWRHIDSTGESYVLAEVSVLLVDERTGSKFRFLSDFP